MRTLTALLALPLLWTAACGDSSSTGSGTGGSAASAQGGTASGAPSAGQGGTAGAAGSSGGTVAGANPGGSGGGGSGGTPASGGAGGTPSAGNGGGGGAPGACTRELLQTVTDAYFTALAAHDHATLPLAASVKFTENGIVRELGEGLWETAGMLAHAHSALDTETCQAISQAVVPDGTEDIPFALRLKLVDQQITEIETIAVRPGDYTVGGQPFPSDTDALIESADTVQWEAPVPEAERNTREELIAWMNKYFRMFPNGVCNTVSGCIRIENGAGNFSCGAGASCAAGEPGPEDNELEPRLILADVERGLGVGFTMFQGHTDMHLFKMSGGEVYGVSAILGAAGSPGWE